LGKLSALGRGGGVDVSLFFDSVDGWVGWMG